MGRWGRFHAPDHNARLGFRRQGGKDRDHRGLRRDPHNSTGVVHVHRLHERRQELVPLLQVGREPQRLQVAQERDGRDPRVRRRGLRSDGGQLPVQGRELPAILGIGIGAVDVGCGEAPAAFFEPGLA